MLKVLADAGKGFPVILAQIDCFTGPCPDKLAYLTLSLSLCISIVKGSSSSFLDLNTEGEFLISFSSGWMRMIYLG